MDDAPAPTEFVAATVIEYDVPVARPDNVHDVAGTVAEQVTVDAPLAVAVAVYDVTATPPSASGAAHVTLISVLDVRATTTFFGALGTQFVAHE